MKKTLLTLLLSTSLLLAACGSSAPAETGAPQPPEVAETEVAETQAAESAAITETEKTEELSSEAASSDILSDSIASADLDDSSIGPVSFTPNANGYSMIYGANTLEAYFKRSGVIPGTGKLQIRKTEDDSLVEEIDLTDSKNCEIGETDSTFDLLDWDGGTHLIIHMDSRLESDTSYYVALEEGAFTSSDGSIASKAITDSSIWPLNVARFGILLDTPADSTVLVGDVLTATVYVRQPATTARLENYDENRVRFNEKEFSADGKLEIKIYQIGEDSFTINFYDDEDEYLGGSTLSYMAEMPPEPEEEAPRKSVTNL